MIRLLELTILYPSRLDPSNGFFGVARLRQMLASRVAETDIAASIPWFNLQ